LPQIPGAGERFLPRRLSSCARTPSLALPRSAHLPRAAPISPALPQFLPPEPLLFYRSPLLLLVFWPPSLPISHGGSKMPSREKKGGATRRKVPAAPPRHPAQVTPAAAAPLHPAMVAPAATTQLPHPTMVAPAAPPPPPPVGFHAPPPSQMGHAASPGPLPPWGGYVNLLQQPQFSSTGENFHFVGHTHGFAPISPSPSPSAQRQPSSQGTDKAPIDVDGGDDGVETSRTTKRRHWSHEEEVRLASAWLNNSNDSIRGNDKKGDTFWKDITAEFNSNAPADRQR
ncbi:unnamed protein product, partial [Urochloa humidicola]